MRKRKAIAVALSVLGLFAVLEGQARRGHGGRVDTSAPAAPAPSARAARGQQAPARPERAVAEDRCRVAGRVLDGDGRAAGGATVAIYPSARETRSDGDGRFTFAAPCGPYVLDAHRERDVAGPLAGHVVEGSPAELVVRLHPGVTLEVQIFDRDAAPIAGAEVRAVLRASFEPAVVRTALADAAGLARFDGLKPGTYALLARAEHHGAALKTISASGFAGPTWRTWIALGGAAHLTGRVVDEAGAPLAGAHVVAFTNRAAGPRDWVARTFSDADGEFELNAPRGKVIVAALAAGYLAAVSADLTLKLRGAEPVLLTMTRGVDRPGRVVTADGAPVADAEVTTWRPDGAEPWLESTVRSARDGSFVLRGLPPDRMVVAARADRGASRPVDVPADASAPLVLTLADTATIAGRVVDSAGRPIADADIYYALVSEGHDEVRAAPRDSAPRATSDGAGRFVLGGLRPDARYRCWAVGAVPAGGTAGTLVQTAEVSAAAGADVTLVLPALLAIRGSVSWPAGAAPAAVTIALTPAAGVVERDGDTFRILDVPPGAYRLTISGAELPEQAVPVELSTQDVALPAIVMQAGRVLEVTVETTMGARGQGVPIEVRGGTFHVQQTSDEKGQVRLAVPRDVGLLVFGAMAHAVAVDPTDAAPVVRLVIPGIGGSGGKGGKRGGGL